MDTNNTTPNQNDKPTTPPITPPVTTPTPPETAIPASAENQYKGVLSNYKEEVNPPVVETKTITTAATPETPATTETKTTTTIPTLETPAPDYSNPEIAQKKLEEILNTPTVPPMENSLPVGPAVDTSPKSSVFRTVFLVALFLFLGISAVIIYFFIKGPVATPKAPIVTPPVTETPTIAPTIAPPVAATCSLNDKQYSVGETFSASDGCNICSCGPDLNITCTQRICASTSSAATKTATPSAATPTKAATATPTKAL